MAQCRMLNHICVAFSLALHHTPVSGGGNATQDDADCLANGPERLQRRCRTTPTSYLEQRSIYISYEEQHVMRNMMLKVD